MRFWIALLLIMVASSAAGEWIPPKHPDLMKILSEAREDTEAGRFSMALEKHLWLHRNSLEINQAFYGVRLSFALGYWLELAEKYPPAMKALKGVRDEAEGRVRSDAGSKSDFNDVSSINEYLDNNSATTKLFVWLDKNDPKLASRAYPAAQQALIEAKEYALCGKYIDSSATLDNLLFTYRQIGDMAKERQDGDLKEHAEKAFTNGTSTLVALLTLNGRDAEADEVIVKVLKEWPEEGFRRELNKAKTGVVPRRWPPPVR